MSEPVERRRVHLLAPRRASLLVDADGLLPTVDVELERDETTPLAVTRRVLPGLRLPGPVLECLIDGSAAHDDEAGPPGAAPVLTEVASPPAGWDAPAGWRWRSIAGAAPSIEPGLAPLLHQRLSELRGERAIPEVRSAWARPGWFERVSAWVEDALRRAGRRLPTAIEPVRLWGISAVLRVTTDDGLAWFKAAYPGFRQEPAVTALLARLASERITPVLATDPVEGWLLLDDVGRIGVDPVRNAAAAFHSLIALQRGTRSHRDHLVAAGARVRPLGGLAEDLGRALADPAARAWLELDDDRPGALVAWVAAAAGAVEALGLPETLVHGDFHPGNVALIDGRIVIIDWSDAALGHPLVDVATWTWWLGDDVAGIDAVWAHVRDAWSDMVQPDRFDELRPTMQTLAAAYHAVSYVEILAGLEAHRRPEVADGLTTFLALLDRGAR